MLPSEPGHLADGTISVESPPLEGSTAGVTTSDFHSIRSALRSATMQAMKLRDREATAVYRAALGAIDNAEAVPSHDEQRAAALESSPVGLGRAEVARRDLSEQAMIAVVVGEAEERSAAAGLLESTNPTRALQLRQEAALLLALVPLPQAHEPS